MLERLYQIAEKNDIVILTSKDDVGLNICGLSCRYPLGCFIQKNSIHNWNRKNTIFLNVEDINKVFWNNEGAVLEVLLHEMCHWYYFVRYGDNYETRRREEAEVILATFEIGIPNTHSYILKFNEHLFDSPRKQRIGVMVRYFQKALNG